MSSSTVRLAVGLLHHRLYAGHSERSQARIQLARDLWSAGQKADARAEYERLLRSTLRSDVTTDLERLASEESVDEPTLRLLGDAYMKEDRLQEALKAYRRALSSL